MIAIVNAMMENQTVEGERSNQLAGATINQGKYPRKHICPDKNRSRHKVTKMKSFQLVFGNLWVSSKTRSVVSLECKRGFVTIDPTRILGEAYDCLLSER